MFYCHIERVSGCSCYGDACPRGVHSRLDNSPDICDYLHLKMTEPKKSLQNNYSKLDYFTYLEILRFTCTFCFFELNRT